MASADKPHALDGHSTLILLEEETSQVGFYSRIFARLSFKLDYTFIFGN